MFIEADTLKEQNKLSEAKEQYEKAISIDS